MSFSKSRVSRFGEKTDLVQPRLSSTDMTTKIRTGSASTVDQTDTRKSLLSQSFIDTTSNNQTEATHPENKTRPRSTAGRYATKISKPVTSRPATRGKSREGHNDDDDTKKTDSSATMGSNIASKQKSSRIPSPVSTIPKAGDFQKRNLEIQYSMKLKRLSSMKKELIEKQKPAVELYKALLNIRKKVLELDGKNLPLEELKVIEYPEISPPTSKELQQTQEKIKNMKTKLSTVPSIFMDLCRKILDEKCGILDDIFDDEGEWSQDDLLKKIQRYKQETTTLEGKMESKLKEEEYKMRELIKEWNALAKIHPDYDEDTRSEIDMKFQDTEHRLKQALADLQFEKTKKLKDNDKLKELEKELTKTKEKILELNKTLEEERTRNIGIKARYDIYEQKLKTAKGRMKEAEDVKIELEKKYDDLLEKYRNIEEDWKLKMEFLETQNKDLQHYVKTQTDNVLQMESEKRSVNARCEELERKLKEQEQMLQNNPNNNHEHENYEEKIYELENKLKQVLNEKQKVVDELEEFKAQPKTNTTEEYDTSCSKPEENTKTDSELTLWSELKATKSALKLAEEKLSLYTEEKARFLETLSREDDSETVNMTTHLMQKEELITNLILQNKQLKRTLHEMQDELDMKNMSNQQLEEKLDNEQGIQNQHVQYCELHKKLQNEISRNTILEQDIIKMSSEKEQLMTMVKDFQHLFNVREQVLNAYKDKQQATEDQNMSLKDYILQMRDQLNLISIEQSKKEQVIKTLTKLLDDKAAYIDKIEERIEELENSVHNIKSKRQIAQRNSSDVETAKPTHSRENILEFIHHAHTLSSQEALNFRNKLRTRPENHHLHPVQYNLHGIDKKFFNSFDGKKNKVKGKKPRVSFHFEKEQFNNNKNEKIIDFKAGYETNSSTSCSI